MRPAAALGSGGRREAAGPEGYRTASVDPRGIIEGMPLPSTPLPQARAYWSTAPGCGEIRPAPLPAPGPAEALVRATHSGISRGTELLVHRGKVPPAIADHLRAPFQEGDFSGPVKYGYLSVGVVEAGPSDMLGKRVFSLFPHQDRYVVPVDSLTLVPAGVPSARAVLAGAVETAVNALWDSGPRIGDRVAVVGAGMIGAALAALLARHPLSRLQLLDPNPTRRNLAGTLGLEVVDPEEGLGDCDLVYHCSATSAGLARSLELLGFEGEVIELSWFGLDDPQVPLGSHFHSQRLAIRASQVGSVAPARRARRTVQDRLALALTLLEDPAFDALLSGSAPFDELPSVMRRIDAGTLDPLCHVITYPPAPAD